MNHLLHHLIEQAAARRPHAVALRCRDQQLSYDALAERVRWAGEGMLALGLQRRERVAVFLEKRFEAVIAMFGAAWAGCVFVPINPLLKPAQVAHILRDCNVRMLVTSPERLATLDAVLGSCPDLRSVIVTGNQSARHGVLAVLSWQDCMQLNHERAPHRCIDSDMVALLYTSGSTGAPKGVILTHRNMVAGAASVASYLNNHPEDRILSLLPLSFDYGLSQLTTAFSSGACAVLMNYLLPRDVVELCAREHITGLACVPPLWNQLVQQEWPVLPALRYLTNSGGTLPRQTVRALQARVPHAKIYLMYGLTEAFRSTFLPPEQLAQRPDSIGKAIPNVEVQVVHPDGTPCATDEPGELVHRGPLVALGYWNDPARTAERFRPVPGESGLPLAELGVWSGDIVRKDSDGYLYYIGRNDDLIKTSGYRVSPSEVEECLHDSGLVIDAVALGIPHPQLGQAIAVIAYANARVSAESLHQVCQSGLPGYMCPVTIDVRQEPLPRNPNGKIDRRALAEQLRQGQST